MKYDRRLTAPLLISLILLGAHFSYGVLRGYEAILLAILSCLATEMILGRILLGQRRYLASAYISGISIGILVHSPVLWPYALGGVLSIMSKYVLRARGRHLWNPSNFGICVLLFMAPFAVAPLSVQWGNDVWPMLVIWAVGLNAIWRVRRAHITVTYVAAFLAFALVRSLITDASFITEAAPITGPMYQLFALFMVTDPKTTVSSRRGELAVVVLVAFVEMLLRLGEVIYAPFYALFLVGPAALLVEMWWKDRAAGGAVGVIDRGGKVEAGGRPRAMAAGSDRVGRSGPPNGAGFGVTSASFRKARSGVVA
jgi:Na+-translocating ferredoxin:NAD+ oxidoreductase RnfD subunit